MKVAQGTKIAQAKNRLITHELMRPGMSKEDLDDVVKAFEKVWQYKEDLLTH